MKYFIASDIHGSAYWCMKMIDAYKKEKADRLVLLGDILYHGPRNDLPEKYAPKEVISLLSEFKNEILCVRGNCDCEVDQMVLPFPILADYALIDTGKNMLFLTHGHIYNDENMPPLKEGDVCISGHTHIPRCESAGGITMINPGSVSIPKNGSEHGYIIFENSKFSWKNFEGASYKSFELK